MTYFIIVWFVMSVITFGAYGFDKRQAKKSHRRVRERTLFNLGFLLGAFGALCAMQLFKHKTKHLNFYLFNILFLLLHLIIFYRFFIDPSVFSFILS